MKEDKKLLESFRKKDNLISNKDLKHFKEMINENKKNFLVFLKEKNYLEKNNDDSYKIKDNILKRENFEDLLWDYDFENSIFSEIRDTTFRKNFTDEELLDRYNIKKENFIIYSQNGDKLYDSESSLLTRDLEEYIIDIKDEEYFNNLKLNDVKSWDNLLKEELVTRKIKKTKETFESFEEYTGTHLEEIAIYTMMETKLLFGEVRQDLIINSEKGLISEEKVEMLENKYSNTLGLIDELEKTTKEILENDFTEREKYNGELLHLKELNEITTFLTSEEKYKKDIEKYQNEIVKEIFSKEIKKISEDEYKFSDNIDFSSKNKWAETVIENCDLGSGLFEVLVENISGSELYRRYNMEDDLEPFKVYHNDEMLYQNETKNNDYGKIREYVVNFKGEEFWDNMNLDNIEEWGDLSKDLVILYGENDYIYTDFYNYSNGYDIFVGKECLDELECFREKVRLDFKENSNEEKIISKENILKIAKEYDCFDEVKIMLSNKKEVEEDNTKREIFIFLNYYDLSLKIEGISILKKTKDEKKISYLYISDYQDVFEIFERINKFLGTETPLFSMEKELFKGKYEYYLSSENAVEILKKIDKKLKFNLTSVVPNKYVEGKTELIFNEVGKNTINIKDKTIDEILDEMNKESQNTENQFEK